MHNLLDPTWLIKNFGYAGIFITIFLESGIIVGFFLPGDSLLFAAGLLASQGYLNIAGIMIAAAIAAILGNTAGYFTGLKLGPALYENKKYPIFRKLAKEAHVFFEKQGPQSLVLARFVPAVRCFVPIVAGIAEMKYRIFVTYNVIGALLWAILIPILGFTLGKSVPSIDKYLLPIILVMAFVSLLPVITQYIRSKREIKSR